ncbi:MAG: efflux RND transporter periplasmic adaptor subunit [Planctomycetes bacterium]|nr:efflux RND transporter periplasmic adaptor subunit [Planctomycetota bacterium]MCB9904818.1 efflux RND transporter periplasmic adaptor subunit [Planctomycetota bacterium]
MQHPSRLLVALLAAFAGACEKPAPAAYQPPLVTITKPVVRDVTREQVFIGETRPAQTAEVRARVRGFLQSIEFEVGADVQAGDVLFTIEKSEFQARVAQAQASLRISEAEYNRAQADFERVETAAKSNAVSASEVGLRRAERDKSQANIEAARAALEEAQLNLSYTDVKSPVTGRVSRNLVDLGNLVGSGEPTLLTTVVELDPLHVYFEISERTFTEFLREFSARAVDEGSERARHPVQVALEGDEGFPHEGYIDFIENTAQSSTGTIQVRAVVPNSDYRMYPGLFARVRVPQDVIEGAVLVQEKAISADLGGKFVLLVGANGTVERRYLKLGQQQGELRVVNDGLTADEAYIVDGMIRARPGLPARTQTLEEAAAAKAAAKPAGSPAKADGGAKKPSSN